MNLQSAFPFLFDFLPHKPVVVEVSNEALSSDGGINMYIGTLYHTRHKVHPQLSSKTDFKLLRLRCIVC